MNANIADIARADLTSFTFGALAGIDSIMEKLTNASPRLESLGGVLTCSDAATHLRRYQRGNRSIFLLVSNDELEEFSQDVVDKLDVLSALRAAAKTAIAVSSFAIRLEAKKDEGDLTTLEVENVEHALALCEGIMLLATDLEARITDRVRSTHEPILTSAEIITAQRGSDDMFYITNSRIAY